MKDGLFKKFITSRVKDSDRRNREIVLNSLLAGTFILLSLFLVLLFIGALLHSLFPWPRIAATLLVLGFLGYLYRMSRTGRFRTAAYLLVALYLLLATAVVAQWGLYTPTGVLLFSLVVVLAGILLGAAYSLYAVIVVAGALTAVQVAHTNGFIEANVEWLKQPSSAVDIISYSFVFGAIALVSWMFNHQMERSLKQAQRAEAALSRQKALLEIKVEKRTRQLQAAQLEEMQQLYRFAELGQLSTALLHDLANHLTTLTLDIEGLGEQNNSRILRRAKRSIRYIDDMVHQVRDQLHDQSRPKRFSVASEIDEVIKILTPKARRVQVTVEWETPADKAPSCYGESSRFRQLIANLISNGIDAYPEVPGNKENKRRVTVNLKATAAQLTITVSDWGRGIPTQDRARIFDPFYSTKAKGMGIGLFITRQIAEEHFGGTIKLNPTAGHTVFTVTLKRAP